ncbi:hypothetical protein KR222_006460, partial [Zaprionus bogoriensis]
APKEDRLVVSPVNVKFQSPFPHNQKRQLSLLNLSATPMVYSISLDNMAQFSVCPTSGHVAAFDTVELTILMRPSHGDQSGCRLEIKSLQGDSTTGLDWSQAQTSEGFITLENCMGSENELLRIFGLNADSQRAIKSIEEQYKPLCNKCCMKRLYQQGKRRAWTSWTGLLWPVLFLLLSL